MISIRNYFTILILLLMVFVMFMFIGVSSDLLSNISTYGPAKEQLDISYGKTITADSLNLDKSMSGNTNRDGIVLKRGQKTHVAILSSGTDDTITKILVEWCVYKKYLYKIYDTLPTPKEMTDFDVVLFGDYNITTGDTGLLYAYADLGKTMIFTSIPDYDEISADRKLAAVYGIRNSISKSIVADGIKIFPNLMINKERNYTEDDYFGEKDDTKISIPYYSLAPGYEVYAVGMLDKQNELGIEDKELPPLLWRATTRKSFVYVINSDIFDGMSMLGILTGFMSRKGNFFVYPIINAQTISMIDYPYFSDENSKTMRRLYSRGSEAVARDLLWPNIIQILKNYGGSYSFFAASQLDYLDNVAPKNDFIKFYLREIERLPGDMGLSLGQTSKVKLKNILNENEKFFGEHLPDYKFTALYTADFTNDDVRSSLKNHLLKNVRLVMSDYKKGDNLVEFLNNDVLSVEFTLDGYQHETMDDLRMICIENALGMCNMKVDIGRVFYPENKFDEWNYLSLKWSKGDTYFRDYSMFEMVPIYEMEKRIRRFLALDYNCKYEQNDIEIDIDHFDKEAYFILCTNNRSIDHVENGTVEEISASMYLIKATDALVKVHMIEENVLEKPKNNKTVPSTPLRLTKEDEDIL